MPAKPEWIENKNEYFLQCDRCFEKVTLLNRVNTPSRPVGFMHLCEKCFKSRKKYKATKYG